MMITIGARARDEPNEESEEDNDQEQECSAADFDSMVDITESEDDCQQQIDVERLEDGDEVQHNNLGEPEQAETIA